MNNDTYKSKIADAEKLTEDVRLIHSKINQIEEEYKKKISPFKEEIERLEQSFLDKYLIDSTGKSIKKGMTIEKDGKKYKVLNRYQQCIFQYLGNARVSALPEGKKRTVEIFPDDLCEYTIVE